MSRLYSLLVPDEALRWGKLTQPAPPLFAEAIEAMDAMSEAMKLLPTAEEVSRALRPWTDPS
jgi:hypothetical protein